MKIGSKSGFHKFLIHKQSDRSIDCPSQYTWFLVFLILITLTFVLCLINKKSTTKTVSVVKSPLPESVVNALLHYASTNSTALFPMSFKERKTIASALHDCPRPCKFLVFGISYETLLWHSLNLNGKTVFIDESFYTVRVFEQREPEIEAYDVKFTTKVDELYDLMDHFEEKRKNECRAVQNLLYSDCDLAIVDMPNHIYEIPWDVILVDGPRGLLPAALGRISTIYTAAVLARSKREGEKKTHVFVHEADREVERVCCDQFLCQENLVNVTDSLAHFVVERMESNVFEFCTNSNSSLFEESK